MKKIVYALIVLLLIPAGLIVTSNFWLRGLITEAIHRTTGFPLTIERTSLDLPASQFGVYGIELNNPSGFPQGRFASIPEIYVDFDLSRFLFERKLYFQEIRIHIEEIAIIRNPSGQTNLAELRTLVKPKSELEKEREKALKASSSRALNFFVEQLVLTIRHVRYQDQTALLSKSPLAQKSIDLHIEREVFRGFSNPSDIVRIIVLRIVHQAAIGNLGIPVDLLRGHLDSTLARGQMLALQGEVLAHEVGTGVLGEGEHFLKQASEQIPAVNLEVKQATGQVQEKAEGFFQGAERLLKDTAESIGEKAQPSTTSS